MTGQETHSGSSIPDLVSWLKDVEMIFSSRLFVSEGKTDRSLAEFSFYECLNFSWAKVPCLSPGDKEKKKEGRKVGKEGGKRERKKREKEKEREKRRNEKMRGK